MITNGKISKYKLAMTDHILLMANSSSLGNTYSVCIYATFIICVSLSVKKKDIRDIKLLLNFKINRIFNIKKLLIIF